MTPTPKKARSFTHPTHTPALEQSESNTTTRRANYVMLGPFFPNLGDSNLLKSEVVRKEMMNLEADYMELAKLGQQYAKFDAKGKTIFIERALDVVDRFAIFLTRMKLSEDFSSQMFIKQYQMKLEEVGLTIDSLVHNTKKSLEAMRSEIPDA